MIDKITRPNDTFCLTGFVNHISSLVFYLFQEREDVELQIVVLTDIPTYLCIFYISPIPSTLIHLCLMV